MCRWHFIHKGHKSVAWSLHAEFMEISGPSLHVQRQSSKCGPAHQQLSRLLRLGDIVPFGQQGVERDPSAIFEVVGDLAADFVDAADDLELLLDPTWLSMNEAGVDPLSKHFGFSAPELRLLSTVPSPEARGGGRWKGPWQRVRGCGIVAGAISGGNG
jgi:hypothetical protein